MVYLGARLLRASLGAILPYTGYIFAYLRLQELGEWLSGYRACCKCGDLRLVPALGRWRQEAL